MGTNHNAYDLGNDARNDVEGIGFGLLIIKPFQRWYPTCVRQGITHPVNISNPNLLIASWGRVYNLKRLQERKQFVQ